MTEKSHPIDPEDLRDLYYWSGLCLQQAQTIEYGLKLLLWTLSSIGMQGVSLSDATDIIEDRNKKTMGQALTLLRKHGRFDSPSEKLLLDALRARNTFIHGFLIESVERVMDPELRPGVVAEIKALRKTIRAGDKVVREFIAELHRSAGLDPDETQAEFEEELRSLNAKTYN
jgi:hypothetical protein